MSNLRKYRESLNISQTTLAKAVGCTQGATASEFATMLAEDIACRNGKQFGFDRLLPSSYLNGQRWNDEKPETIQPQSKPSSAITVSKTGYVFFDR